MTILFGDILKEWRGVRRISQLDLSLEADTSTRHVSFLESGRSSPSREMVLKLSEALQMPRSDVNKAMLAAGFAPVYPELPQDDEALQPVLAAIDIMLNNHEPYPGLVLDRHWNLVKANRAALKLFSGVANGGNGNMVDMLIEDVEETSVISNWAEVATLVLARLKTEHLHLGGDAILADKIARLSTHPRLLKQDTSRINLYAPVVPLTLELAEARVSFFSIIAQFGTVQDVTFGDIQVELMFPADDETRAYLTRK